MFFVFFVFGPGRRDILSSARNPEAQAALITRPGLLASLTDATGAGGIKHPHHRQKACVSATAQLVP